MTSPPISTRPSHTKDNAASAQTVDNDLPTDTTLPLPLSASMILSTLPNDASTALARAQDQVSATEGIAGKRMHYFPPSPRD